MAQKRKRVGEIDTSTLILIAAGAAALLFLMSKSSTPAPTIIKTGSPSTGQAQLTAAEIAAGAGLVTTAITDFTSAGDDDSDS
jgi:hypothetical protein